MGSEWSEIALADCLAFVVDNRGKSAPLEDQGIPLIATNCISNENTYPVYERVRYVSEDTFNNWFRSHPLPGDVILTTKGSKNGAVCLVPSPVEFCIAQDMVALRANKAVIDPLYLFAILRSKVVQDRIKNLNVDSVIPHFKKTDFDKLFLPYPSRKTQEFIGRFYFYFCEKIELNRQINTTLESMAQALFKSWFVDFDPVIDNALAAGNEIPDALAARAARREALRQQTNETSNKTTGATDADSSEQALTDTGLSDQRLPSEIQQRFPDRFVFTEEMGWVPEGWGIESLDRIANYQNGLALQKFRPEDESNFLPVVKIAQLKKGYADGEEKASPNIKPECIIDDGDVVFSWSGSLMVDVWCGGRAALNQHLFKVTSDEYPKWFFLHFTLHHLTEFQRIAADKAVTMGHIKREHLSQAKCSVPGMDFMEKLSPFFDPLLNKAVLSRLENRALIDLRDSLLPKLLSGQITIPDAEQQLAEVL